MNKTPIEWTDFTVNPFRFRNLETGKVGHYCEKISPGCKNCYSSKMQTGPYLSGLAFIAENKPKGEFFLDESVLRQVLRRKKPARIFWCDMTDMFLEDYPDEWIDRCFAVMDLTPHLTHQVLTKRAKRLREYLAAARDRLSDRFALDVTVLRAAPIKGLKAAVKYWRSLDYDESVRPLVWPLPNVWLGVSVEDQQRADERIPHLLATPAAVRFLSVEPLLGEVRVGGYLNSSGTAGHCIDIDGQWWHEPGSCPHCRPGIDWVIVGGESGPGARPCDLAWIRSIVQQCKAAGVPPFVKQAGAFVVGPPDDWEGRRIAGPVPTGTGLEERIRILLEDRKGGDMAEWPEDLRGVREYPGVRA